MKILLVCNKSPWPPKDGGAMATLSLAQSMVKKGLDVTILAMNTSRHYQSLSEIPEFIQSEIRFHFTYLDTKLKFVPAFLDCFSTGKPYIARRFYSEQFLQKLKTILKNENFDIIQFEGLYTYQYINDIRPHSKALITYRPHNLEFEIWKGLSVNSGNILRKLYFSCISKKLFQLERNLLNLYDCLIPISSTDLSGFNQIGNRKPAHVTPYGIFPAEEYSKKNKLDETGLFFIGALDWLPNQEGVIWFCKNIWPQLKNKYPELTFRIAGRNAPAKFVRHINKYNVLFEGEVENSGKFMRNNGIMIVPLLSGSGMRVKIIEGMARGIAIVATNIAAMGIPVSNKENIMIADSIKNFTYAIEKLISDAAFRNKISENAWLFALANFNNFDIADNLINFYNKMR